MWRGALVAVVGVVGGGLAGCVARPIHANMTDDVAAGVLKECFEPGMSPEAAVDFVAQIYAHHR